jgi:type II secretion system protein N
VSAAARAERRALPRSLRWLGPPFAALFLIGFFVFLGFPWARISDAASRAVSQATGTRVRFAELSPGLSAGGPVLVARGVEIDAGGGGGAWKLDEARLRPAWSLAWLRGRPALAADVRAPEGHVDGVFHAGPEPGFDGRIEGVALARLPLDRFLPTLTLDGVATADVDLRRTEAGPAGSVALEVRDGSLALAGMPMALPFETLEAEIELGGELLAKLSDVSFQGPMLAIEGGGTVGAAADLADAPLDLKLEVEVREPAARPALQSLGFRLDRDGKGSAVVGGTLGAPEVR